MRFRFYNDRTIQHFFSLPFIYSMIVPSVILDIFLTVYHAICFRVYGISLIPRSRYIRIDRQKLSYLNPVEKLHCMYCGYVNGLYHYAMVIAGETEKYWCGIKHKEGGDFVPPPHQRDFLPYDNKKALCEFVKKGRKHKK